MNGSVRQYKIDRNVVINLVQRFQQEFVPVVREMPEFVAFYVITRGADIMTTVAIFDSQAGVDRANQLALETIRNMGALVLTLEQKSADGEAVVRITRH
ncbi:MAG: hypothetical protein ACYDER_11980 [Ktedonobacteraceae bacterium]